MIESSVPREGLLDQLIRSSIDGILAFDHDCRYTVWNPAMEQMTGVGAAEVLGRNAFEAFPFLREIGEDRYMYEALAGRQAMAHPRPFTVPGTGSQGFFEGAYAPVYDASGAIVGGLAIIRDVTERVRELEQLRQSEQRLEEAQALAHIGYWEWHVADDRIFWSDELYRIYGLDPADGPMSFPQYRERLHPEDRDLVTGTVARSRESGEPFAFEHRIVRPDGTVRWVHGRGQVIKDAAGRLLRMFGTSHDITEQHELRTHIQAEAHLREQNEVIATINRIGTMISAELDLHRLVQAVTDAATDVTGAQFGAFFFNQVNTTGEHYTLYTVAGAPREAFARYPLPRKTALFGPTFRGEGVTRIHDVLEDARYAQNPPYHGMPSGHLPVRSYLAVPVISRSGNVLGGLFFGHAEPGVFTAQVEQVVVGLAAQTAIAMDNARLFLEAQQAIQARDTFFSMAAHELRTPLTAILGYTQLLTEWATRDGTRESRQGRALQTLHTQVEHMERLVHTLLDLSRMNLGAFTLQRTTVNMGVVVKRTVEGLRTSLDHHTIVVREKDGPHLVDGDETRLEQVVHNLLQNAINYSPHGGRIEVFVESEDDQIVLTIQDQGIGIPEASLPQIFNRFFRASNAAAYHVGGLGVGLYVVREIVTLHGGRIEVESTVGSGTIFRIFLIRASGNAG